MSLQLFMTSLVEDTMQMEQHLGIKHRGVSLFLDSNPHSVKSNLSIIRSRVRANFVNTYLNSAPSNQQPSTQFSSKCYPPWIGTQITS